MTTRIYRSMRLASPLLIGLASLSSCEHKVFDPAPESLRVKVVYDWQKAPQANPAGMCAYFYQPDADGTRRADFSGTQGGYIDLTPGQWHVISYNNDTEAVLFGGDGVFTQHHATTREGNILEPVLGNAAPVPPRAADSEDERVLISPDMLWGHSLTGHTLTVDRATNEATVTLTPEELVCTYTYEVRNVKNLDRVARMCGSITGMSPGLDLHSTQLHNEAVTVPFAAEKGDATTIVGKFLTFGHHELNDARHRMVLYIWMEDGSKFVYGTTETSYKWDVTDQVHNAPDKRHVHIVIDGMELPEPYDVGGIGTTTDDWGVINCEIEM